MSISYSIQIHHPLLPMNLLTCAMFQSAVFHHSTNFPVFFSLSLFSACLKLETAIKLSTIDDYFCKANVACECDQLFISPLGNNAPKGFLRNCFEFVYCYARQSLYESIQNEHYIWKRQCVLSGHFSSLH